MARLGLKLVGLFQPLGAAALTPVRSHRTGPGNAGTAPSPALGFCVHARFPRSAGSCPGPSRLLPRQVRLSSPPTPIPTSGCTSAPANQPQPSPASPLLGPLCPPKKLPPSSPSQVQQEAASAMAFPCSRVSHFRGQVLTTKTFPWAAPKL